MMQAEVSVSELNLDEHIGCQYADWEGRLCDNKVEWICTAHMPEEPCKDYHGVFLCDDCYHYAKSFDVARDLKCNDCGQPGIVVGERRI